MCSAGNNYQEIDSSLNSYFTSISRERYPSVYERILVVGACDNEGKLTDFSNGGDRVDLTAPGNNIKSTGPGKDNSWKLEGNRVSLTTPENGIRGSITKDNFETEKYVEMSGTSQATPYVTGTAAMAWTLRPELGGDEVKELLVSSSTRVVDGYHILNAQAVVDACLSALGSISDSGQDEAQTEDIVVEDIQQLFSAPNDEYVRGTLEDYYQDTLVPQFGLVADEPVRVSLRSGENTEGAEGMTGVIQGVGQAVIQSTDKAIFMEELQVAAEGIVGYRIDDFDEDGLPELLLMRTEIDNEEIVGYRINDFGEDGFLKLPLTQTEIDEEESAPYLEVYLEMYEYSSNAEKVILQDQFQTDCSINLEQYPQNQIGLFLQKLNQQLRIVWGIDSLGTDREQDTCRISVLGYSSEKGFYYIAAAGYGFWDNEELESWEILQQQAETRKAEDSHDWGRSGRVLISLKTLADYGGLASDKMRSEGSLTGLDRQTVQTENGQEIIYYFSRSFFDSFAALSGEDDERWPIGELTVNSPVLENALDEAYDIQGYDFNRTEQTESSTEPGLLQTPETPTEIEAARAFGVQVEKIEDEYGSAEYPVFSAVGESSAEGVETVNRLFYEEAENWKLEAKQEVELEQSGSTSNVFEITCTSAWIEDQICSVAQYYYKYTGGAHGYGYTVAHSYDLVTGEELSMGQLLGCGEEAAREAVVEAYRQNIIGQVENITEQTIRDSFDNMAYWMNEEGMHVSIPTAVIASYSAGPQEALVTPEMFPEG